MLLALELSQWRQLRQLQRYQQRANQQSDDERANPVPPGKVPEKPTRRPGNARPDVIAEQVQRRRLPLGFHCAAADPAAGDRVGAEEAEGEHQHARYHQPQRREERQGHAGEHQHDGAP